MASTIPSGLYMTQAFLEHDHAAPRENKVAPRPLPIAAPMRSPASSKEPSELATASCRPPANWCWRKVPVA